MDYRDEPDFSNPLRDMDEVSEEGRSLALFPAKLDFLFHFARFKVLYGGRGGAKSWSVARVLLIRAMEQKLRVLCAREFQNSIGESVHFLLCSQIDALGMNDFYTIQKSTIIGANGSEFIFAGLRNNVTNIKSLEALDIAWVEEAQKVSHESWKTLIPTVRKDPSEIWITYNPELETDETHQRFVMDPPDDAVVVKIDWRDNHWLTDTLRREKDEMQRRDPEAYANVWDGQCRATMSGAIYGREIRKAEEEGRITRVPYDQLKQVHTFWDLGWADNTSIWFAQTVGAELRMIDYYSNNQMPIAHYLSVLQQKGYVYGIDWLPHDAKAKTISTGRSTEEIMLGMGRRVQIVAKLSLEDGINAARTLFNRCYFDREKCTEGLQALRHYRYDVDAESQQLSGRPLHDWSSHSADAFRYFAVSIQEDVPVASARNIRMVGWRA